jgi:hypothetical protein
MRRIAVCLLLLAPSAAPAEERHLRGLTDAAASPHVVVRAMGLSDVRWVRGFWANWSETCRKDMVPTMGRIMEGTEHSQFLHNFRIAAGLESGRHRGVASVPFDTRHYATPAT